MVKAGDEYQEIVAAVVRVLDPGATVTVGAWKEGPDGLRDMDVSVVGAIDGKRQFVLIECKDWTRPIGIGVIDALESKRRDLQADLAILYSNSGFTRQALRKAQRVGIKATSALAHGDERIKVKLQGNWIAKALSIDSWNFIFFPSEPSDFNLPQNFGPGDLTYHDRPVVNWFATISTEILREHEDATTIQVVYAFREVCEFSFLGIPLRLRGLGFLLKCSKKWLSQIVEADVTLGLYDHMRQRVVIPDQQGYMLGPIDPQKWEEIEEGWTDDDIEQGTFDLQMTLYNPVRLIEGRDAPDIDALIAEKEMKVLA